MGLNVLVLHPMYAGSHVLTLHSVCVRLLERGHTVTTVKFRDGRLPALRGADHPNYTLHDKTVNNSEGNLPFVSPGEEAAFEMPLREIWAMGGSIVWTLLQMFGAHGLLMDKYCQIMLDPDLAAQLLERGRQYDVAIVDLIFNECGLALAHRLGAPAVGYWAFSMANGLQEFTTMDAMTSYVPNTMSRLGGRMTLPERTLNLLVKLACRIYMYYEAHYVDWLLARQLPESPGAVELIGNLSGVLINTDYVLDYPRPNPPTFVNVGGLQIAEDPGPLPASVAAFMDGAGEAGVVLFTMGFIFDPTAVPERTVDGLLEAFSRLPQRVVFKYDSRRVNVPPNVLVVDWAPQQAILAHPSTRVFVTHCGMHGVIEGIYHEVEFMDNNMYCIELRIIIIRIIILYIIISIIIIVLLYLLEINYRNTQNIFFFNI